MQFLKQFWKPLLWTIIILILCLMPKSVEPQPSWLTQIPHFDKIVHFGLYTILGFLFYLSKHQYSKVTYLLLVLFYAIIIGGLIEIIQPFVGRSKEFNDLLADIIGSLCGISLMFFRKRI